MDRLGIIIQSRLPSEHSYAVYRPIPLAEVNEGLEKRLGWHLSGRFKEPEFEEIEHSTRIALQSASGEIPRGFDADPLLAKCCYAICRAARPTVVVETGVCHGVTTAYILQALEANRKGTLISIDLPPLGAERRGEGAIAVPNSLKKRWILRRGTSRRMLGQVLREYPEVDMFIHDSLHTFRTMAWEFETIHPNLTEHGVVIADDVEGNAAFQNWARKPDVAIYYTIPSSIKDQGLFGVGRLSRVSSRVGQ